MYDMLLKGYNKLYPCSAASEVYKFKGIHFSISGEFLYVDKENQRIRGFSHHFLLDSR